MSRLLILVIAVPFLAGAQTEQKHTARKKAGVSKPECAPGAICFSGEAGGGDEFRKNLNDELAFVLSVPGEFRIELRKADPECNRMFWVANPPFRAHHDTEIDASYDWTAEQEVETSPREFRFATQCSAYRTLFQLSETDPEKYFARFDSLADGRGRLWITDSRVTHAHGGNSKEQGAVEGVKFSVEIKLPAR